MKVSKSKRSLWGVKLIVIAMQFSAGAYAEAPGPTLEQPIQVFQGPNQPFAAAGLIECPGCDKNTYSEEFRGDDRFNEKNKPDTLYTWTKSEWAQDRFTVLQSAKWQGLWRPLFLTRAPLSSYPYGEVSLRIKLKPGIKFRRERTHCAVSVDEAESSVYLFSGMMNEFLICSPKVIESVSFATKAHYDEMIRGYLQHKFKPEAASYYLRNETPDDSGFFGAGELCPDNNCYVETKLIANLRTTLTLIRTQRSRIFFNPEVPQARRTEQEHFRTDAPMYFHAGPT